MKEPDVFLRRVRYSAKGATAIIRVFVVACANSSKCSGVEGSVCPECKGARLTWQEKRFLESKRVGNNTVSKR